MKIEYFPCSVSVWILPGLKCHSCSSDETSVARTVITATGNSCATAEAMTAEKPLVMCPETHWWPQAYLSGSKRDHFRAASNSLNCTEPPANYAAFHFNVPTHSSSLRRLSITINNNSLNDALLLQNTLHVLQLAFTPHFLSRALIQTPKERAQSQITKKLFHRLICFSLLHHNAAKQYVKKRTNSLVIEGVIISRPNLFSEIFLPMFETPIISPNYFKPPFAQ